MITFRHHPAHRRPVALLFCAVALFAVVACLGEGGRSAPATVGSMVDRDSEPPEPRPRPYREVAVGHGGTVAGAVTVSGEVRSDTSVRLFTDQGICGDTRTIPVVKEHGGRVEGAIVWLADARRGKPLPLGRRYTITTERCALEPRVQAVVVGGTLNVYNADPTVHRTRFVRVEGDSTIRVVHENDAGQVVPLRRVLARPGLIAVRCDVHPWTRGWVRVFDHPYFDVADRDGRFTLDSVPPGTYHLVAWQPRLGRIERTVTVRSGEETRVEMGYDAE